MGELAKSGSEVRNTGATQSEERVESSESGEDGIVSTSSVKVQSSIHTPSLFL